MKIYSFFGNSLCHVYRINPDNSLTEIAEIENGKQTVLPKYKQKILQKRLLASMEVSHTRANLRRERAKPSVSQCVFVSIPLFDLLISSLFFFWNIY